MSKFTIEDSSRSFTVHRENCGYQILSFESGARIHCSYLTFEQAVELMNRLNRISDMVPNSSPALVFAFATGTPQNLADVLAEETAR